MTWILIKIAIRFVIFGAVFGVVAWKNEKVTIEPKRWIPVVAVVFAGLNIGLYWLLKPVLNLATFGSLAFLMPFIINGGLLYATNRIVKHRLQIDGILTTLWLAGILTLTHGALWVALDVIP